MEAIAKLDEAQYFLEQIKDLEEKPPVRNQEEFRKRSLARRANVSAFILAWDSIPGIMLYDFAEKFKLPYTREDRMMDHDYALAALYSPNRDDALDLLAWRNKEVRQLWQKHERLDDLRNVLSHRGIVVMEGGKEQVFEMDEAVNTAGVSTTGVSAIASGSYSGVHAGSIPKREVPVVGAAWVEDTTSKELYVYGVLKPIAVAGPEDKEKASRSRLKGDSVPIVDRCQSAYDHMRKFVSEADREVWKKRK